MTAVDRIKCRYAHSGMTSGVGGFQNPAVCLQAFPSFLPHPLPAYSRHFSRGPCSETARKRLLRRLTLPVRIATNETIVVDMRKIKDDWQDDHRWNATSGAKEKKYKVSFEDGNVIANPSDSSNNVYKVQRHRFVHDSASDFHRLVITVKTPEGETYPFALVQYRFDEEPHVVVNKPHGNSKNDVPFVPTKKSTLEKLTAAVKEHNSIKRAMHKIE